MGSNDRVDGGSSEWEEKEVRVKEAGRNVGKLDRLNVTGGDDVTETFECSPKASLMMVLSTSPESLRVYLHDDDQEEESVVTDEGRGATDRNGQAESSRETVTIISVDERSTLEKEMEVEALRKFRISFPMSTSTADDDDRLDLVEEAVVTPQTTVEEGLMLTVEADGDEPSPAAAASAAAVAPLSPSQSSLFEDNSKQSNKKRYVLLLLLLIVVVSVIVLGVFLANKTTEKEDEADKALGVYTPPEAPISSQAPSTMLSYAPEYNNPSPPPTMTTSLSAFSSEIPTNNPLPQPISSQYQQITGPIASSSPTEMPVCEVNYDDFNLCIAIDMSGSGESQA